MRRREQIWIQHADLWQAGNKAHLLLVFKNTDEAQTTLVNNAAAAYQKKKAGAA